MRNAGCPDGVRRPSFPVPQYTAAALRLWFHLCPANLCPANLCTAIPTINPEQQFAHNLTDSQLNDIIGTVPMQFIRTPSALVLALTLSASVVEATEGTAWLAATKLPDNLTGKPTAIADQPSATYAAKTRVAKPTKSAQPSASTTKRARSSQPQQPPSPATRRATAGPGAIADPVPNSPVLLALQQAERELFGFANYQELPDSYPHELLLGTGVHAVSSSGIPPSVSASPSEPEPPTLDFLQSIRKPDIPVKWTPRVLQYLDFYKNDPRGRAAVSAWYRLSGRYEPMLRAVLKHYNLPEDLMWVAVVESGLRPTVYSPAGAAGLWQFMPESGRLYGLVVDRWVDERLDPVRSTHAAAMYLQDLHRRFASWDLAMASYNMGYGGMLASIRKYNTNDFWELCRYEAGIPWETTLYVPRVLALAVVAKNPDVFGLTDLVRDPPVEFDEVDVVPGASVESVAQAAEVNVSDIEQLNPQLLASRIPPQAPSRAAAGVWTVRVPRGLGAKVIANLTKTRAREPELVPYTVRHGESLAQIAEDHAITTQELARNNAILADETISPGTVLMVPPKRRPAARTEKLVVAVPVDIRPLAGQERRYYQVVSGDTLEAVASAFSVRVDDLTRWNGTDSDARLHSGMTLLVLVPNTLPLLHVRTLTDNDVRLLVVGSDAFFDYHEGLKGRVRVVSAVRQGETWKSISERTGLSVGMLERINRRSRNTPLQVGERFVVYVPAAEASPTSREPAADEGDMDQASPGPPISED